MRDGTLSKIQMPRDKLFKQLGSHQLIFDSPTIGIGNVITFYAHPQLPQDTDHWSVGSPF